MSLDEPGREVISSALSQCSRKCVITTLCTFGMVLFLLDTSFAQLPASFDIDNYIVFSLFSHFLTFLLTYYVDSFAVLCMGCGDVGR